MGYERKSHVLHKEPGVLPGSEFFVATHPPAEPDALQYLSMCGHYHCSPAYRIQRQRFDNYIMVAVVQQGQLSLHYGGAEHLAGPGDILAFDLLKPHCYTTPTGMEFTWLHIEGDASRKLFAQASRQHGVLFRHGRCPHLARRMGDILAALQTGQMPDDYAMSAVLYDIMCSLHPPGQPGLATAPNRLVQLSLEYMKYNLSSPISLSDMAAFVHMSKHHFCRQFKRYTGETPYSTLLRLRMDAARYLLSTTDKTVKEVAQACGYASEMGFTQAFTERIGMPPGAYRKHPF